MNYFEYLQIAKEAALGAGKLLNSLIPNEEEVLSALGKDIKLKADKKSELFISETLVKKTGIPLLGEEYGLTGSLTENGLIWIVDPLDGTLNFSRGVPFYCISIALWKGKEPILGVIYDLVRGHLYSGGVGMGAWSDESPMRVAKTTQKDQAIIATGFPTFRDFGDETLIRFIGQVQQFKKVRLFGAAALSLALCASGAVDAYAEEDIMLWDVAAGIALVKASGGIVRYAFSSRLEWGLNVFCACSENMIDER